MHADRWDRIADLFAQLTTLPPEQRESFLAETCGEDAGLRRELDSLMQAHDARSGPLDGAPHFAPSDGDDVETASSDLTVGPYKLLRLIGEGGMGSVWLAERADGVLKRTVALKRPHVSWVGTLAERMARERDILASLEHSGIARLYDAGVTVDGRPYLALEYIEGVTITEYCDSHGLSVRQRLEIFLQVLDAVSYAHSHLVVHRDIKPSNILVSADSRVHLLDFGIAKLLDQEGSPDQRTQWAPAVTPDYASPEQVTGQAISTASDVYSLGVLLSELLSGERPYALRRTSRGALEEAILEVDPRAPSRSVSTEAALSRGTSSSALTRELSGDLDNIVLKALSKKPADRYATADLFSQDITRYLQGEAVQAHPGSTWYHASKFLNRHKLAVGSASAVVVALVTGTVIALSQAREARLEAARAEQVKSFALSMLESADIDSGAGVATTAVDLLQAARRRVETELAGRPAIAAELMTAIGYGLIGQSQSDDAVALLEKAVKLSTEANGAKHPRTLTAQVIYAEALYNVGRGNDALPILQSAATQARILGETHTQIDALRWISSIQIDAGESDAAIATARQAVAALPAHSDENRVALLDGMQAHLGLANALGNSRQLGAVAEAKASLRFHAKLKALGNAPRALEARVLLGQGLVLEGQVSEGLRELEASYQEARVLLGDAHQQTGVIAHILGTTCLEAGNTSCAVKAFQASYDTIMSDPGQQNAFTMAMGHYGLAASLAAAREHDKALPHFAQATKLFADAGGPDAPLALRARSMEALSLAGVGRLDESDRRFASLASAPFAGFDKPANDGRLAILRGLQGRHDEAIALARTSARMLETLPSRTPRAQSLARLGTVLLEGGHAADAVVPLEQSVALFHEAQPEPSADLLEAVAALERARAQIGAKGAGR